MTAPPRDAVEVVVALARGEAGAARDGAQQLRHLHQRAVGAPGHHAPRRVASREQHVVTRPRVY